MTLESLVTESWQSLDADWTPPGQIPPQHQLSNQSHVRSPQIILKFHLKVQCPSLAYQLAVLTLQTHFFRTPEMIRSTSLSKTGVAVPFATGTNMVRRVVMDARTRYV